MINRNKISPDKGIIYFPNIFCSFNDIIRAIMTKKENHFSITIDILREKSREKEHIILT